jgi:type III secretory pathway component EscS
MPELLNAALTVGPIKWEEVAIRLIVAVLLGRVVALVYTWTRMANERTPAFPATLVLLTVLIAMVAQAIGENLARAFSLVGTLSIVRFRTVVRDTIDTAFVIFAVIIGMAVGAANLPVALIGIVAIAVAAQWMKPKRLEGGADSASYILNVRAGLGQDLNALLGSTMDAELADRRLLSVGTAKQGTSLEAVYEIRLRKGGSADGVVKALNRLDGVQSVEIVAPGEGDDDDD